jgi:hypothetical protein
MKVVMLSALLDGQGIEFWWGKIFFTHPDQPWSSPIPLGLGCCINHSSPSVANVKERMETYLFSTSIPSWQGIG